MNQSQMIVNGLSPAGPVKTKAEIITISCSHIVNIIIITLIIVNTIVTS